MLRYLAPVTLGVCAVSVGILSGKPAPVKNSVSSAVRKLFVASAHCSGGDSNSNTVPKTSGGGTMDYNQEAERMAQRVYEMYNDKEWKVAKTSVRLFVRFKVITLYSFDINSYLAFPVVMKLYLAFLCVSFFPTGQII